MEVVDGAIEIFQDVAVRRVSRSPEDPPARDGTRVIGESQGPDRG
jgi:hypothetical protein